MRAFDLGGLLSAMGGHDHRECQCADCRIQRGEAEWVDVRELTPSEIEEKQSLKAQGTSLQHRLNMVNAEIDEWNMRQKLFWSRIERELGDFDSSLSVDQERMVLRKLQSREVV